MEKLRHFATFCNVAGLFPFLMKIDKNSGRFDHFKFSYHYFSTWWCFISTMIQITAVAVFSYYSCHKFSSNNMSSIDDDAKYLIDKCHIEVVWYLVTIIDIVNAAAFAILALMPRMWTFNFKRLKAACDSLHNFDQATGDQIGVHFRFTRYSIMVLLICCLPVCSNTV